jgi:hypothetical protein
MNWQVRELYRKWMKFAEAWGAMMTSLVFGVCYLLIFGLFYPFLYFGADPLGLNKKKRDRRTTFWIARPTPSDTVESLRRLS